MAIEKYRVTTKEELHSIFQGMKDINGDPFFDNVELYTTGGGLQNIYFQKVVEDVATTLIDMDIRTSGAYRGNVRVNYTNAPQHTTLKLCPITYPVDVYVTRYGFLIDAYDGTYTAQTKKYPFGMAKTAAGSIIAFGCPYDDYVYTTATTERKTLVLCPEAPFDASTSGSAGIKDGQPMTFTDPHLDHTSQYAWSTLIELPVYSSNPMDHMDKAYLVYNNQTTLGEYGYFTYQGHTYLTNGFWAILDT